MGTRYEGTASEIRALNAFIKLTRGTQSLLTRLEPHITRHGITTTQFGILETLLHVGPLNQRELGQKLLLSKGNISVVVSNLEKSGLVNRRRDEEDRRQTIIHLTAEGRKLVKKVFPKVLDAIVNDFSNLTADELETLGRLAKKVGRAD